MTTAHRRHKVWAPLALAAVVTLVTVACGDDDDEGTAATTAAGGGATTAAATTAAAGGGGGEQCDQPKSVSLQLQWFTQGQFAGYFAAQDQGYYKAECLDVKIVEGGVDIVPQNQVAQGAVDFAIAWVPKALASRNEGAKITDIAQIFQRSGTLQVSWKDANITKPADLKGKKVGNWGFGNEFELLAGLKQAGLNPSTDVELVQQQFDMVAITNREIDAAQAMTYNEYAQMLETPNPATGQLIQPSDLNVINWNDVGTAMLQDAVWAQTSRLSDPAFQDTAVRFLKASMKGWAYCRDNLDACTDIVLAAGPTLGASHQKWQINEINKLIWPSPAGIGIMDKALWDQTISVATSQAIIPAAPDADAYRTDLAQKAVDELKADGVDVTGTSFKPATVELQEGGN